MNTYKPITQLENYNITDKLLLSVWSSSSPSPCIDNTPTPAPGNYYHEICIYYYLGFKKIHKHIHLNNTLLFLLVLKLYIKGVILYMWNPDFGKSLWVVSRKVNPVKSLSLYIMTRRMRQKKNL